MHILTRKELAVLETRYDILDSFLSRSACRAECGYPLFRCSTFRIGGPADYAVWPDDAQTLCDLLTLLEENAIRYLVIGNGSDFLFDDRGFRGVIVVTSHMREVSVDGTVLTADCGASLLSVTRAARDAGLSGLEFAYGIPGSCGGAVFMNAGAYGGEISDVLCEAVAWDRDRRQIVTLSREMCAFGYRQSAFQAGGLILLRVRFSLTPAARDAVGEKMEELMRRRVEKQPLEFPSAGSVFKRACGHYTGQMIEEAGLKGKRIGGAAVSEKHAGFIVNMGGATSSDVLALIALIREEIMERFGVALECEIRYCEP